jgi:DNA-binding SARP family transcriptional activator
MKFSKVIDNIYRAFLEYAANANIILLHPRSRYRSVLIARLVNSPDVKTFYYALGPDDLNVDSFLAGVTHDVADQVPTFGRHLHMLPRNLQGDFDTLLHTFAQDITELSDDPFFFILDEYDRSDGADDVQHFVERLSAILPPHVKLVINSRTLPRLPWISMISRKGAVMLQDDQLINQNFYDLPGEGKRELDVYTLGPGFVLMDGEMIDAWEGHLPRLLFFFALDRPVITRSEICLSFWPELESDQAVNVFHVTKRRLHKALDMDVLVHDDGYYRVNPDLGIHYDALEFVTSLMEGRNPDNPDRLASWERAATLYRGPFLQGHDDGWILDRRQDFTTGYLEALTEMAHIRMAEGRREYALTLLQRGVSEDYSRQDVHREIMVLLNDLGRRSEAIAHYQRLVDSYRKENLEVADDIHEFHQQITD